MSLTVIIVLRYFLWIDTKTKQDTSNENPEEGSPIIMKTLGNYVFLIRVIALLGAGCEAAAGVIAVC